MTSYKVYSAALVLCLACSITWWMHDSGEPTTQSGSVGSAGVSLIQKKFHTKSVLSTSLSTDGGKDKGALHHLDPENEENWNNEENEENNEENHENENNMENENNGSKTMKRTTRMRRIWKMKIMSQMRQTMR